MGLEFVGSLSVYNGCWHNMFVDKVEDGKEHLSSGCMGKCPAYLTVSEPQGLETFQVQILSLGSSTSTGVVDKGHVLSCVTPLMSMELKQG